MANVYVLDHPLIQHKLAILRSKETPVKEFRELVGEIAGLMCYEATRNLPTKEVSVETPITTATCHMLAGKKMAIVPILRAGLGMVDLRLLDVLFVHLQLSRFVPQFFHLLCLHLKQIYHNQYNHNVSFWFLETYKLLVLFQHEQVH